MSRPRALERGTTALRCRCIEEDVVGGGLKGVRGRGDGEAEVTGTGRAAPVNVEKVDEHNAAAGRKRQQTPTFASSGRHSQTRA